MFFIVLLNLLILDYDLIGIIVDLLMMKIVFRFWIK
jgi:hypothetical protein